MFSTHPLTCINFWVTHILLSANAINLDKSKILSFGKELKHGKPSLCSSVGSIQHLRKGCWFNLRFCDYSFRGLMIVIMTGFNTLSPLTIVWKMVTWESSQWFGKNIVQRTGKKGTPQYYVPLDGVVTILIYLVWAFWVRKELFS